jgi:hypothetical protein
MPHYYWFYAPDGGEKPGRKKLIFSCRKRATRESSFFDIRKKRFSGGLATDSWIRHMIKIIVFLQYINLQK